MKHLTEEETAEEETAGKWKEKREEKLFPTAVVSKLSNHFKLLSSLNAPIFLPELQRFGILQLLWIGHRLLRSAQESAQYSRLNLGTVTEELLGQKLFHEQLGF